MSNNENYEVGYKKPPKHTRFKKGQSGNPKGRPKGSKNTARIVNDILDRTVTITENGRPRKVKFLEAFMHQMAAKALNGSTRDQIALFKTIHDYAPELIRGPMTPEKITIEFVDAKDGRPYPYEPEAPPEDDDDDDDGGTEM